MGRWEIRQDIFDNTDWRHIYKKIVENHDVEGCKKIKKWMEQSEG